MVTIVVINMGECNISFRNSLRVPLRSIDARKSSCLLSRGKTVMQAVGSYDVG